MSSMFDEESFGHCEKCRKEFYNDTEIFKIIMNTAGSGITKLIKKPETIPLCRDCYTVLRSTIKKMVFEKT